MSFLGSPKRPPDVCRDLEAPGVRANRKLCGDPGSRSSLSKSYDCLMALAKTAGGW